MMRSLWGNTVLGLLLAGAGLASGLMIGHRQVPADGGEPEHEGPRVLSPQTLANLGVVVGKAKLGEFVEFRAIQAVVEEAPLARRPVATPLAGIVQAVAAAPGTVVQHGATLATVLRDAIPRPKLEITADIVNPISESLHTALTEMRTAARSLAILDTERRRIEQVNAEAGGVALVDGRRLVEIGYERARAEQRVDNARFELRHHGLSAAEVAAVEKGDHPPHGRELWQRVLTVHGLWTTAVGQMQALLPESYRNAPWTIGLLGELSAVGLADPALLAALRASSPMRTRFRECAALLLRGETLPRVRGLAEQGALDDLMRVAAPNDSPDWDLVEVAVRPGQPVVAGQTIAVVRDARSMWLRLRPVGNELGMLRDAVRRAALLEAVPTIEGTGPILRGLRVLTVGDGAPNPVIPCANDRLARTDGVVVGWQLQAGTHYRVRIPQAPLQQVFVLPVAAVVSEGADRVVYLQDGDSFRPKPVRVVWEDREHVVVANDGALFPNDAVVESGAFALSLAMQRAKGGDAQEHHHHH
ncbi:MAG: efflux RND transporter periplasmic adaptor subunit [Planctomycetes bacterium]|nr:efflux RND transporter periplasmic adaptor subunit [Planctomycetota bacterium]MCB9868587.1 efflux RND transporter periplasmic adaptor subunit [Planctomycetota bacterium]